MLTEKAARRALVFLSWPLISTSLYNESKLHSEKKTGIVCFFVCFLLRNLCNKQATTTFSH